MALRWCSKIVATVVNEMLSVVQACDGVVGRIEASMTGRTGLIFTCRTRRSSSANVIGNPTRPRSNVCSNSIRSHLASHTLAFTTLSSPISRWPTQSLSKAARRPVAEAHRSISSNGECASHADLPYSEVTVRSLDGHGMIQMDCHSVSVFHVVSLPATWAFSSPFSLHHEINRRSSPSLVFWSW